MMQPEAIRSLLFVPGDREAIILKALDSEADAVILDLEDSVAPERKAQARQTALAVLQEVDRRGKAVFVRVNAFDTGMVAVDAAATLAGRPWGVMLPKSQGPAEVQRLSHMLDALEAREGIVPDSTRILTVATETAAATQALSRPAGAGQHRLWGMLWGGEDLAADLGATANRDDSGAYSDPFRHARTQCLFAANALSVAAVDAVHTDFRDLATLEQECRLALRDGFVAKAAIHPAQVAVINRVLTPDPARLDWARQVMALLQDQGVARLDGRMIDIAHKRIAARLLARAAALATRGS